MRHFVGFKRICAIVQPDDEELKRREWKRTFEDGEFIIYALVGCCYCIISSGEHSADLPEIPKIEHLKYFR